MRSKWQLVRDLFERALEEQPADLDAWLAEATDDPEVRAEVRSLLDESIEAGQFLSEPVQDRFPSLGDEGEDEPFQSGHVIGHYTIVRQLPPGGMGRVYHATDTYLGRNVVLKSVAARFIGDPAHEERLQREAQALADLDHPGICKVYAFEKYDGEAYIVTEYVNGQTLREEIAAGSRPRPGEVLRTARDIAAALACAHARKIAHRDLKPDNVMRTADGGIKIIDFGIARVDHPDGDRQAIGLTQTGVVLGTPTYMAPEQLNNERVGVRADVFAFGVLIYELACGLHPFGSSPQQILYSDPPPIESLYPALAGPVSAVIGRCLKKLPAERFASAGEIAEALPKHLTIDAVRWWRAHQAIIVSLYFFAAVFAWFTKQELGSTALNAVFGLVSATATVGGVMRSYLLFVERVNRRALAAELRRTGLITMVTDALVAVALSFDGVLLFAAGRHLASVLIAGLGIGIVLARLVLEPFTTTEAFPDL
jgi:tRNA A-37 threonylcarbamoyl transferase component Bud32